MPSLVSLVIIILSASSVFAQEITLILRDLRSRDPQVLSAAVERLGQRGDEEAVKALMGVVEEPVEDWKIQVRAINLLAEIGNPMAIDLLINVLNDPFLSNECPALRWNAARALGRFGNEMRILSALQYRLDDRDLYVREAVIQSLGEIGNPSLIPVIAPFLSDRSFALRMSAVKAMGKIGSAAVIPFLEDVSLKDKDPAIRQEAIDRLRALKNRLGTTKGRSSTGQRGRY